VVNSHTKALKQEGAAPGGGTSTTRKTSEESTNIAFGIMFSGIGHVCDVNERNSEAVRFYQACGFTLTWRSEVNSSGRPFPLLHMRESGLTNR
jgi:hypothetical protein